MGRIPGKIIVSLICTILICHLLPEPSLGETGTGDGWKFHLAPYAWLAGQNGEVATLPELPPADIDIDFWDDILGNINGAIFLVGEARKERYGALVDIAYVDIEIENSLPGPLFSSVTSTTKSWLVSAYGMYRLMEQTSGSLDLIAGARFWSVESSLALGAGIQPSVKVTNKEDWIDPLAGLKGLSIIGASKFFTSGNAVLGGFGVGSDLMWDLNLNLGYRWTQTFSTVLGYRYLDVDYKKDDFIYDIAQHGPILGLSWRF